jgi:peptidyl-prolyl cis-trans isomerase A (cyclophilin A)
MISMQLKHVTRRSWIALCASVLLCAPALAQTAPQVKFQTSQGDFVVEVYPDKAPRTVENFLQYVQDKHYDGTIFHRVIANFMIQGGGFTVDMNQKATRTPIPLEAMNGLNNDYGTIAMARTNIPNSATSQFFVNVKTNDFLNAKGPSDGYTVFGKVISGMEVVEKIKSVSTGRNDVPQTPILINSATLVK